MTDDNIAEFRRKVQPILWSDGTVQNECDRDVHLFESIPGRCQCGERLWTEEPERVDFGYKAEDE